MRHHKSSAARLVKRRLFPRGWKWLMCLCLISTQSLLAGSKPSAPPCPPWTQGGSPELCPTELYLCGLGVVSNVWNPAQAEEAGKTAALADIARQLQVDISTTTHVKEQLRNGVSSTEIRDQSRSSSELRLEGVSVEARCFDASSATFYVLGRVERLKLAEQLTAQLQATNQAGASELQTARELGNRQLLLDAIGAGQRAREHAREAERLSSMVRGLTKAGSPAPFASVPEVKSLLEALKARAYIQVQLSDPTGILDPAVRTVVSSAGLQLQPKGSALPPQAVPVLLIRGTVNPLTNNHARSASRVWISELQLVLEIVRLDTRGSIGSLNLTERAGASSSSLADQRAAQGLAQQLEPVLPPLLKGVLPP